jgi:hypothetical protein
MLIRHIRRNINVEFGMWNLELVALRAMKNFPINNYY